MAISSIFDDGSFWQIQKQMRAVNSLLDFGTLAQRLAAHYESQLDQMDAMVKAMRSPLSTLTSGMSTSLSQAGMAQLVADLTAPADAVLAIAQSSAFQTGRIFARFPASFFESLSKSQEVWFEAVRSSTDFLRLQSILGTDLAQLLTEQAEHYQATLDGRDAFTRAFALCHKKLHFKALGILKNIHDAEDALQDAAEKALLVIPTYSTERLRQLKVEAWFMTIVTRTALNLRRDTQRHASDASNWLEHRPGSNLEQPETHLLRREMFRAVQESFQALSKLQHKILLLRYFDFGAEMTWEELASHVGCTLSNAKVSHKRGLETLRKQLDGGHFTAADLAIVLDVFSPGFAHREVTAWLRSDSEGEE